MNKHRAVNTRKPGLGVAHSGLVWMIGKVDVILDSQYFVNPELIYDNHNML